MKKIFHYLIMQIKTVIDKILRIQTLAKEVEDDLKELEKEQTQPVKDEEVSYVDVDQYKRTYVRTIMYCGLTRYSPDEFKNLYKVGKTGTFIADPTDGYWNAPITEADGKTPWVVANDLIKLKLASSVKGGIVDNHATLKVIGTPVVNKSTLSIRYMVTAFNQDWSGVVTEPEVSYISYNEPEPEEIRDAYITFDGYDSLTGTKPSSFVIEGTVITLPSAYKKSTAQYNYTFTGWRRDNDAKLYKGGEKVTIWGDSAFTAQFTAVKRTYVVKLVVNNGKTTNSVTRTVLYGNKVAWVINPNEGYEMPKTAINGTVSGRVVYSNYVYNNITVIVSCQPVVTYVSYTTVEPDYSNLPMWQRPHKTDPDVQAPRYIEVDMADPWKDYAKNAIRCLNGSFKEEFSVLKNDLVEFAGPMGDNIWLGKKEGIGYVILVGPNYSYENKKDVYTVIKVKVYNSDKYNNSYVG